MTSTTLLVFCGFWQMVLLDMCIYQTTERLTLIYRKAKTIDVTGDVVYNLSINCFILSRWGQI